MERLIEGLSEMILCRLRTEVDLMVKLVVCGLKIGARSPVLFIWHCRCVVVLVKGSTRIELDSRMNVFTSGVVYCPCR